MKHPIDMDDLPEVNIKVPTSAHPAAFLHSQRGRDNFAVRAAATGLSDLYIAWSKIEDTIAALTDKAKSSKFVVAELTKAQAKADGAQRHLAELERTHDTSIKNTIGKLNKTYASELRSHYKGKFSELAKDITDPQVAAAVYGVPAVLLGLTPEQVKIITDRIEQTHAPSDYQTRDSARKAQASFEATRERFQQVMLKRVAAYENSDDRILERAAKPKDAA